MIQIRGCRREAVIVLPVVPYVRRWEWRVGGEKASAFELDASFGLHLAVAPNSFG